MCFWCGSILLMSVLNFVVGRGHGQEGHEHGGSTGSDATSSVGLVVTLALFAHKAPEAAGYGTFILHKQCSVTQRIAYIAVSKPNDSLSLDNITREFCRLTFDFYH